MSTQFEEKTKVVSAPAPPTLQDKVRALANREVDASVIEVLLAIAADVEQLRLRK